MKPTRLFALGGMNEIGKTTIVIEYDSEIFIIDAGIKFPESWLSGIDGIIPNYSYLKKNQHKIKGLLITHAHEDHIGGIPYLLKQVKIKDIYIPKIGVYYVKNKLKEHKLNSKITKFHEIDLNTKVKSEFMEVDFYTTQHSIPDSFGIRVKTPNGTIVDTGDFRFDYTPIGNMTDFKRMEEIGKEGVDILISDSTNAMYPDHSPTEMEILKDIKDAIVDCKGLTILTTFASNLTRINAIIEMAESLDKKVVTLGRSMVNGVDIAKKIGYLSVKEGTLVSHKIMNRYDRNELLVLATGSQGEEMAALNRISQARHAQINLKPEDTIIFSASPIPGNRITIESMINRLYKLGANIKEHRIDGLFHTSGHAYKEEHIKTFELFKPKYFIPYHGEYRMSRVHGETAIECGVKRENVILIKNGDVVEMHKGVAEKTDKVVNADTVWIDSGFISQLNDDIIKEREELGGNGFISVVIVIDKKKNAIMGRPRIISRGTFYAKDNRDIIQQTQKLVHGTTLYFIKNTPEWKTNDLKKLIEDRLQPFFYKLKRREPKILTSIITH